MGICCRDDEYERSEGQEGEGERENKWVCIICREGEVRDGEGEGEGES